MIRPRSCARRRGLVLGLTCTCTLVISAAYAQVPAAGGGPSAPPEITTAELTAFDLTRPEIRAYIDQAAAAGLDRERIMTAISAAEPQREIIDAMNRPAEKTLQWWEYRAHMLTHARIEGGAQLWCEHKELLDQIASEYQVPPEYLLAVLGVETLYGRFTGHYRVLDALATLAFDYPPRAAYFRRELTDFLLLTRDNGLDPLLTRGSYAGAMGALQFMPSSYRKFAISAQLSERNRVPGDAVSGAVSGESGHIDLWSDWGDIFASTANFLHQAGWRYGAPVLAETPPPTAAQLPSSTLASSAHVTLSETLGELRAAGLSVASTLPDNTPAVLLAAPEPDAMHYRVGFQNFYVITRYNGSPLYAMAVYDLAQAIRERMAVEAAL